MVFLCSLRNLLRRCSKAICCVRRKIGYRLDGEAPQLTIPTSLRDSLMARLDRLASVKDVAQIGAALGRQFTYEVLAAVAPHNSKQLQDALNKLTSAGLVTCRGTPPRASITFKHALIQNAAYSTLLRNQRQALHAQNAQYRWRNAFRTPLLRSPKYWHIIVHRPA